MQFITLLLTIVFVLHPQMTRGAPLLQTGGTRLAATQPVSLLTSTSHEVQLADIPKQAENHTHPFIGYDPTGHHGATPAPPARQQRRELDVPPLLQPAQRLAAGARRRRAALGPTTPHVKQMPAQAVQNVYKPLQHAGLNPNRRPVPIPRPAIFASDPRIRLAKAPIQRPPPVPPHIGGYVHDIQKSSKWDSKYHAGVKGPGVRPY